MCNFDDWLLMINGVFLCVEVKNVSNFHLKNGKVELVEHDWKNIHQNSKLLNDIETVKDFYIGEDKFNIFISECVIHSDIYDFNFRIISGSNKKIYYPYVELETYIF